jgi:two-component system, chemotaxis family, CheB/CheR fusion protein
MSAQAAAVAPALAGATQIEPEYKLQECTGLALVVDDNPDIAEMLAVFLRHAGYTVSTAHSTTQALDAALARHFDVVVSDIGMPGMTGHELAQVLRAMPEYRSIPLVAVTGFDMYDDRERSRGAGFSAHLRKPIDPSALARAIRGVRH